MKKYLETLIANKKKKADELRAAIKAAATADEVRSLGDQLNEINTEIMDAETQMRSLPDGLNPMRALGGTRAQDQTGAQQQTGSNFAETRHISIGATEARSVLLATGSIAKPTEVGGITDPFNVVSSIVDQITVEDMTGMGSYKEAYVKAWQVADKKTDGTAQAGSDPTFRTVAINPYLMAVTTYVSRELEKLTPLQYEAKVRQGALIALKKKLAAWIVSGAGVNEPYGVYNAVNTETSPESMIDTLGATAIDEKTLRNLVFAYGGAENIGSGARLYLNKKDLIAFGDVRGANEKKAVYEITPDGGNPNTGIIKDGGLAVPYTICSDVASFADATASASGVKTMFYGDPRNYKLGLFGNYEVNVSKDYKFGEGLNTIMGEVMVGGNVVVEKGFVVLLKKTAAA